MNCLNDYCEVHHKWNNGDCPIKDCNGRITDEDVRKSVEETYMAIADLEDTEE